MVRVAFGTDNERGHSFSEFVPRMSRAPEGCEKWLSIRDWWEEGIYVNHQGKELSRRNLCWALRSRDGGSHFDENLPDDPYLHMKEQVGHSMGFPIKLPSGEEGVQSPDYPHLATMRVIAWEIEQSLERYFGSTA